MIATESPPGPAILLMLLMVMVPVAAFYALSRAASAFYTGLSWLAADVLHLPESNLLQLSVCLTSTFALYCILRFLRARLCPPKVLGAYLLQSRTVFYKNGRRYSPAQWQARQEANSHTGLLPEP